jgi:hypothetical protein
MRVEIAIKCRVFRFKYGKDLARSWQHWPSVGEGGQQRAREGGQRIFI